MKLVSIAYNYLQVYSTMYVLDLCGSKQVCAIFMALYAIGIVDITRTMHYTL